MAANQWNDLFQVTGASERRVAWIRGIDFGLPPLFINPVTDW